ncbi:hypothetical protein KDM41_17905 [bacterium]|nr:hypothetical protein [bacterium]
MNIRTLSFILALGTVLAATPAHAFDGDRRGFLLGLGAGYGSAEAFRNTDKGTATSFKIGAGLNDRTLLYYSNRVVFFSQHGDVDYQGMTAAGVSFYLQPDQPSFFFSGELGVAARRSRRGTSNLGFTVGVGYEFTRHLNFELNYMNGPIDESSELKNFTAVLSWIWY